MNQQLNKKLNQKKDAYFAKVVNNQPVIKPFSPARDAKGIPKQYAQMYLEEETKNFISKQIYNQLSMDVKEVHCYSRIVDSNTFKAPFLEIEFEPLRYRLNYLDEFENEATYTNITNSRVISKVKQIHQEVTTELKRALNMPTASEDERESSLDEIKWLKEDDFIHEVEQKKESKAPPPTQKVFKSTALRRKEQAKERILSIAEESKKIARQMSGEQMAKLNARNKALFKVHNGLKQTTMDRYLSGSSQDK